MHLRILQRFHLPTSEHPRLVAEARATRALPGCLESEAYGGLRTPEEVAAVQLWESEPAHDAYAAAVAAGELASLPAELAVADRARGRPGRPRCRCPPRRPGRVRRSVRPRRRQAPRRAARRPRGHPRVVAGRPHRAVPLHERGVEGVGGGVHGGPPCVVQWFGPPTLLRDGRGLQFTICTAVG
ncbi:antibiotic biosynthesis monooxygenase [Nocardioides daphniae]|uniref:antibiotic biosynthesis monooxygenase n=1 Tax=Nocardioides daphniae TaxID=402297 RepID=UPI0035308C1E